MFIELLLLYAFVINLSLFIVMWMDKNKAKRKKRRISEATLFCLALLGGALGGWFGMYAFRHKTKHLTFKLGFPLIIILHIIFLYFWLFNG